VPLLTNKVVRAFILPCIWLDKLKTSDRLVGKLTCATTTRLTPQIVGISGIVVDRQPLYIRIANKTATITENIIVTVLFAIRIYSNYVHSLPVHSVP